MPRIFDNIDAHLDEALRRSLAASHRLDACVGYFNLRGWGLLAEAVDEMPDPGAGAGGGPKVRLLLGRTDPPDKELAAALRIGGGAGRMDNKTANRMRRQILAGLRRQLTFGCPTSADEAALGHLARRLREDRVQAKLYLRHRLHAKLYLCRRGDHDNPATGFVGSSNFTLSGLARQGELNVDVLDHDATRKLQRWFDRLWGDQFCLDITPDLIELLEDSWAGGRLIDPYLIYLKLAYHLSREAREGLVEYGLPESMARDLFDHQAAAVKIAARILDRRGGVMVGDVVGLGKTMTASALALLLQEERGFETLIICPKNLAAMWKGYVYHYRLHAEVLPLSMAARKLPDMRRYRLVIIDESHNLRNPARLDHRQIKDYIQRNDSKVILLTATPYNKRFGDVAGQLGLFVHPDADLGIRPEQAVRAEGEFEFSQKCGGKLQTLGAFTRSEEPEDWRRLMSLFLIRRTRRFIEKNYGGSLVMSDGKAVSFPERTPRTILHEVEEGTSAAAMTSDGTLDAVEALKLPRYSLPRYLDERAAPTEEEAEILADWKRAAGNLTGITKAMLYKRLSSSGAAFVLSLERHLLRNRVYLHAVRTGGRLPIGQYADPLEVGRPEDEESAEEWLLDRGSGRPPRSPRSAAEWKQAAEDVYQELAAKPPKPLGWLRPELFTEELEEALRHDSGILEALLQRLGYWRHEQDSKLDALEELLTGPHRRDKVLIFTEYRDTAEYAARALRARGVRSVEPVSGSSDDPTLAARRFSPRVNQPIGGLPDGDEEVRVLVATDVLSEGQNLQDSHIVVNFDLPWAIVKIIQRAGRVDRIGQSSPRVLVYSFLPAEGVDEVIGLRKRIARRLAEHAYVFGSDEEFFGQEGERRFLEGLYDENARMDDLSEPDEEVDWASHAYEIWRDAEINRPEWARRAENLADGSYASAPARATRGGGGVGVRSERAQPACPRLHRPGGRIPPARPVPGAADGGVRTPARRRPSSKAASQPPRAGCPSGHRPAAHPGRPSGRRPHRGPQALLGPAEEL